MQQLLKLAAVAWVLCGMSNAANAYTLVFSLTSGGDTWTLRAKTDAPGGIASFAVDLQNATTGVSDAPRGTFGGGPVTGFALGNAFTAQEAFARQNTSIPQSVVYGLGKNDVPPSAFAAPIPFPLIGTGVRDADGYITLYHGTGNADYRRDVVTGLPYISGSVFVNATGVGATTLGQEIFPGSNLTIEPPSLIPEPSAIALVLLSVPALVALRRRLG
jgi:hypothetical protein